jgi:uncharacterized protein involved in exopolysaccharide biosynthesis
MNKPNENSLFLFLDLIKEYRDVFLLSIIVPSLAGLIYALIATSLFRADVIIISNQEEGESLVNLSKQYSSLAAMAGISIGGSTGVVDKTDRSLAILTSRSFIEEFVQGQDIRKHLFSYLWDTKQNRWKEGEPTAAQTYKLLISNVVNVDVDRRTNLITLSVTWEDPVLAAQWANQIIKDINKKIREQEIKELQQSIAFMEVQLDNSDSSGSLNSVMFNLIEELTKKVMIANVREEYAFKIIDPAVVPEMKHKPSKRNIVVISFLMGLLISMISLTSISYSKKIISDYKKHIDS